MADEVPQNYVLKTPDSEGYVYNKVPSRNFNMRFKVRCFNDARVRLSETNNPNQTNWPDPMLEISIRGFWNLKSAICRDYYSAQPRKSAHFSFAGLCKNMVEVDTPGILSEEEFRGFWIKYLEGSITVGKENEVEPFLAWTDPAPINVAYFGVTTPGEWEIIATGDVASLKSACRDVILQHIQEPSISSLALPKTLKEYLMSKEVFPEVAMSSDESSD